MTARLFTVCTSAAMRERQGLPAIRPADREVSAIYAQAAWGPVASKRPELQPSKVRWHWAEVLFVWGAFCLAVGAAVLKITGA